MNRSSLVFALLSAALFGLSTPIAKVLIGDIPPVALAGLLYLGAFAGLSIYSIGKALVSSDRSRRAPPLRRKDVPWLVGAVMAGGIAGPISLMLGLKYVSGFSASLLLNLEGVATALIAVLLFKEAAGRRLWLALGCMTLAGVFLSWDPVEGNFSIAGPLLIVFGMVCWGVDNNLTRNISDKDPVQITIVKGAVAGTVSLSAALFLGMKVPFNHLVPLALTLGAFSYGVSLVLFIKALEGLGSARTGTFFSFGPFVGALASLVILREWIGWVMFPAAGLMAFGVWLIATEKHSHVHLHEEVTHSHSHGHDDGHHTHKHAGDVQEPHSHEHLHVEQIHSHVHWPDTHHRHEHGSKKGNDH